MAKVKCCARLRCTVRAIRLLCLCAALAVPCRMQDPAVAAENGQRHARIGAHSYAITDALLKAKPEWRQRLIVDDLRVTALFAEYSGEAVCLIAYDICEISRREVLPLKEAVANALAILPECVHIFCSHTHSSSMDDTEHDTDTLTARSIAAALQAKSRATEVQNVSFLRVDTGTKFNINRRTLNGELGTWCLMQSRGCTDDGGIVDGTEWVRGKLVDFGATVEEVAEITGPIIAARENDPFLELILFPKVGGGYAGGLVRFTAHPVVCSAGYWKPNLGRDYPGPLCDRLSDEFGCPILFLQGPCGDHRTRHRETGIAERDRIGLGLAQSLIAQFEEARVFPFDRLDHTARTVVCPLREAMPHSAQEANRHVRETKKQLERLPHGREWLKRRKDLAESMAFFRNAARVLAGSSYLTKEEAVNREAGLTVSHIAFGDVHLLNFPGELFSTVAKGLTEAAGGPTVVVSFADGVTGYLMPQDDLDEGGYESTWVLFTPESMSNLRTAALELVRHST